MLPEQRLLQLKSDCTWLVTTYGVHVPFAAQVLARISRDELGQEPLYKSLPELVRKHDPYGHKLDVNDQMIYRIAKEYLQEVEQKEVR